MGKVHEIALRAVKKLWCSFSDRRPARLSRCNSTETGFYPVGLSAQFKPLLNVRNRETSTQNFDANASLRQLLSHCWLRSLIVRACHILLAGVTSIVFALPSAAQVFDPGPSDPSLFATVINLPPDPNIGDGASIGDSTQLNVSNGGVVGNDFTANSGSEVNLTGGLVGQNFEALSGSEVNVSGGTVGSSFEARPNSFVRISGGTVGKDFDAIAGSDIELVGGEFRLNGEEYAGTSLTLNPEDLFTGTLVDGSTFLFTHLAGDLLIGETLTSAPIPALDTTPMVIDTDVSSGPSGLRRGQSLTLQTGGDLGDNFAMFEATLNVEGGSVGSGVEAVSSTLNISGGSVGSFDIYADSQVSISGGSVSDRSYARSGSVVHVRGGHLGGDLSVDGEVNISGGTIDGRIGIGGSSEVNISDGMVGHLSAAGTSQVNISGGVVGSLHTNIDAEVNISAGTVTGSIRASDGVVNISGGSLLGRFQARSSSEVNISGGTLGRTFTSDRSSKVRLSGGTLGQDYRASPFGGGELELIGGEFRLNGVVTAAGELTLNLGDILTGTLADGSTFTFSPGLNDSHNLSTVTLTSAPVPPPDLTPIVIDAPVTEGSSGLRMGQSLSLQPGGELRNNFTVIDATLNVEGGIVGNDMEVVSGTVNINAGAVGHDFSVLRGEVNVRGGTIDEGFKAFPQSLVNILGTQFLIDGLPLDALSPGETITIGDRDVTLSGRLADGSAFSFELNDNQMLGFPNSPDYFDIDATLTVTLVPEPNALCLLLYGTIHLSIRRYRRLA